MKYFIYLTILLTSLIANNIAQEYAPSSDCKKCHPAIYEEFSNSMHAHSTPQQDAIHNAVWAKHPDNTKQERYSCGKCHTPTADNLDDMKTSGKKAMPLAENETHQAGISCAYCHRIQSIELHKQSNTNIMTEAPRSYFGTLKDHIDSPYHGIMTEDNEHMQNGNVCIGCHSHNLNNHNLNLCSTNVNNELDGANCVSCHMPKVEGTVSNFKWEDKHTFHGFAGSHFNSEMLEKYVDISVLREIDNFTVNIDNRTSHALLLHPLRTAVLKVNFTRDGKTTRLKDEVFVRIIGHDGKPAMPWSATTTIKDTMIQANEKRAIKYDIKLQKGDRVDVVLGWYLINPKAVEKLGLKGDYTATKFTVFKDKSFNF